MDITIEAKMVNGSHYIFASMASLANWLAKMKLEPCENGWNEHDENTQRRVAYSIEDTVDDPSCELIVYSPIVGQARKFIVDDENSF